VEGREQGAGLWMKWEWLHFERSREVREKGLLHLLLELKDGQ
jgi:hypothetical protein